MRRGLAMKMRDNAKEREMAKRDEHLADHSRAMEKFACDELPPYFTDFEEWWSALPKDHSRSKSNAWAAWDAAMQTIDIPAEVIEAARVLENAGNEAEILANFVLELGIRT